MTNEYPKELGKVDSVNLRKDDHGIMTVWINLNFGGTGQGFGGYALDQYDAVKKRRVGTAAGLDYIMRLLDLFDVASLDQIAGRACYAIRESDFWGATIIGLETPQFDGGKKMMVKDWRDDFNLN